MALQNAKTYCILYSHHNIHTSMYAIVKTWYILHIWSMVIPPSWIGFKKIYIKSMSNPRVLPSPHWKNLSHVTRSYGTCHHIAVFLNPKTIQNNDGRLRNHKSPILLLMTNLSHMELSGTMSGTPTFDDWSWFSSSWNERNIVRSQYKHYILYIVMLAGILGYTAFSCIHKNQRESYCWLTDFHWSEFISLHITGGPDLVYAYY